MRTLLFILLATFSLSVFGQTDNYEIQVLNKIVGNGTAVKSTNGDGSTSYQIKSSASAKIFFKQYTLVTDLKMSYKNGKMTSLTFDKTYNGEQEFIEIKYEGSQYYFYDKNGNKKDVEKDIKFTSTEMFFKEPVGISEVYVERINAFAPIENLGDGKYKTKVDGNVNFYTYENGELVEFKIKALVNVYMNKI
ncbi:MAG: DUF6134 family protein [Chitinophagales bacterium]